MAAWTYMLLCADGSYYVGCTTNLDERYGQHLARTFGGYTAGRRPLTMVWAEEFQTIHDAIGSCPIAWCNCGGLVTALSGVAGSVS